MTVGLFEFDPNKALMEIRAELDAWFIADLVGASITLDSGATARLSLSFRKLDEWLTAGGYPPASWDPFSKTPKA